MTLHTKILLNIIFVLFALSLSAAHAEGFDEDRFDRWIEARVGDGEPVYWYSYGTLRSYPDGKLLAKVEGYDTARMHQPDPDERLIYQYNRKIYIYRDPQTGLAMRDDDGELKEAVAYPYQFITYRLDGEDVETFVEQGVGERVQRIGPGRDIKADKLGNTYVFSAPVFLDFPIGEDGARYQSWENYDFFIQPDSVETPNQLSWARYGPGPRFAGGGPTIMHLVTYRIDNYEDVPQTLRAIIEKDAPSMAPAASVA